MTPLNQAASLTTPDARTIFIKPWEKGLIQEIEKAIINANLGVTPQNDGQQVIINVPILTEERRKQLVKQVGHEVEHGKVSIRNIRKETNEHLKKIKGVSEDDVKKAEGTVQTLTDDYIHKIDGLMKKKESEIMTV
jgi:ribosome recycling factor